MRRGSRTISVSVALALGVVGAAFGPAPEGERPREALDIDAFHAGLARAGIWEGGSKDDFEFVGRSSLATAILCGLNPDDQVLDIGAGSLRVGWWFLHYVDPTRYHAVEPVKPRIDTAVALIDADIHVHYNDDFEFPDVEFDFVIARSIWSHASKSMISKMLAEFSEQAAPGGKFLTSVKLAKSEEEDYLGDEWVGKVEKGDEGGIVKHAPKWIRAECAKYGLTYENKKKLNDQTWLLIERAP